MTIVLCRHAQTAANSEGRFLSRTDLPLDATGREQCMRLRERFSAMTFDRCFVSPMKRTLETLALALPDLPKQIRPELREIDFGAWEMLTADEIEARWPGQLEQRRNAPVDFKPPEGESFADVARRLSPLMDDLQVGRVLVIAHRGTLGVLERLLRGVPLDYRNIAPMESAGFRVVSSSDVPFHDAPSDVSNTSLQ